MRRATRSRDTVSPSLLSQLNLAPKGRQPGDVLIPIDPGLPDKDRAEELVVGHAAVEAAHELRYVVGGFAVLDLGIDSGLLSRSAAYSHRRHHDTKVTATQSEKFDVGPDEYGPALRSFQDLRSSPATVPVTLSSSGWSDSIPWSLPPT